MKVVHIINTIETGGAENILLNSIDGFNKYWHSSSHYLIVLYGKENDQRLKNFDQVIFLQSDIKRLILKVRKVKQWVESNKIKVIHSHLWDSLIFARLVSSPDQHVVHTYHSIDYQKGVTHHSPWRILLDKYSYRSTPTLYVSESVKHAVQYQIPKQEEFGLVHPNFCTENFHYTYKKAKSSPLRLIAVGNLKEVKNYKLLVDALAKLENKIALADIYGEGSLRGELETQIKGSGANVHLKGRSKISSILFSNYDAFVMTSKIEGMPVALLEAMASGLPSILPNHLPVMKELAKESAFYFETSTDLMSIIKKVYDKDLVGMSLKAHELSEKFSLKNYILNLKAVYTKE